MYRSMLYVPAHSERFLNKAHERRADAIILDLEDAVPEADKDAARRSPPFARQVQVHRNSVSAMIARL